MKKASSVPLLLVGIALVVVGFSTANRALAGKDELHQRLVAEAITTPAGASLPNRQVADAATAESMAKYIDATMAKLTGGRNYSQVGHYLTPDGKDTNDVTKAALVNGQPTVNPLRELAFEASTGSTGLYASVLASNVADLAVGLGVVLGILGLVVAGVGVAFAGLTVPAMTRRLHLRSAAPHHV